MTEINDNSIVITDESGNEDVWKILFFYDNPERKKTFYFIFKDENPDELLVMTSEDGKSLMEPNEDEMKEASEMLETYERDPQIASIKGN